MKIFLIIIVIISCALRIDDTLADTKIKVVASKGNKHMINVEEGKGYVKNGILTIEGADGNSQSFKILKINKRGNKLIIQGKKNGSLKDLCSESCIGKIDNNMEDSSNESDDSLSSKESPKEAVVKPKKEKLIGGFLGAGYSFINDFSTESNGQRGEDSYDLSISMFLQKDVFQKEVGNMNFAISAGAGSYLSLWEGGEFYSEILPLVIVQSTLSANINLIPIKFVRLFVGPNLNYNLISDREYFLNTSTVTEERTGGFGFGYQAGVNLIAGPIFLQLKYQKLMSTIDFKSTVNGSVVSEAELDFSSSFLTISLGATF